MMMITIDSFLLSSPIHSMEERSFDWSFAGSLRTLRVGWRRLDGAFQLSEANRLTFCASMEQSYSSYKQIELRLAIVIDGGTASDKSSRSLSVKSTQRRSQTLFKHSKRFETFKWEGKKSFSPKRKREKKVVIWLREHAMDPKLIKPRSDKSQKTAKVEEQVEAFRHSREAALAVSEEWLTNSLNRRNKTALN